MDNNMLLHRKVKIILASIDVIDEFGINGFSTREVANRVGISEPAIFKHFKTKSELILAVLDHFSLYDLDVIQSIRLKQLDPIEAIINFVDTYATYYENYPAITALTQNFDILRLDPVLAEKIQSIYMTRINFVIEMIEQAKKSKEVSSIDNTENMAVTIIGLEREWCFKWRLSNFGFSLRDKMVSTLRMVLLAGFRS